jgi:hypothetical protein
LSNSWRFGEKSFHHWHQKLIKESKSRFKLILIITTSLSFKMVCCIMVDFCMY